MGLSVTGKGLLNYNSGFVSSLQFYQFLIIYFDILSVSTDMFSILCSLYNWRLIH